MQLNFTAKQPTIMATANVIILLCPVYKTELISNEYDIAKLTNATPNLSLTADIMLMIILTGNNRMLNTRIKMRAEKSSKPVETSIKYIRGHDQMKLEKNKDSFLYLMPKMYSNSPITITAILITSIFYPPCLSCVYPLILRITALIVKTFECNETAL